MTFTPLYLLQGLTTGFIVTRSSSRHRLFISTFMIAFEVIYDDTYSNNSRCTVNRGTITLREINQMECKCAPIPNINSMLSPAHSRSSSRWSTGISRVQNLTQPTTPSQPLPLVCSRTRSRVRATSYLQFHPSAPEHPHPHCLRPP